MRPQRQPCQILSGGDGSLVSKLEFDAAGKLLAELTLEWMRSGGTMPRHVLASGVILPPKAKIDR